MHLLGTLESRSRLLLSLHMLQSKVCTGQTSLCPAAQQRAYTKGWIWQPLPQQPQQLWLLGGCTRLATREASTAMLANMMGNVMASTTLLACQHSDYKSSAASYKWRAMQEAAVLP